jgi:GT2 family glycosyltransferase
VDADDYIYPRGLQILVEMMEFFPGAGFGLCSLDQNIERPFPILLTPKESYTYHFIGPGLFNKAPLSAIIKRDIFEKENGFNAIRMAGDFEMWHRLAKKYPMVAMPHGIVWYRKHAEQEMSSYRKYIPVYEKLKFQFLKDKNCPLGKEEIRTVIIGSRKKALKEIFKGIILLDMPRIKDNYLRYSIAGANG